MIDREPIKFAAYLIQGKDKISIEAKYASKFSLLIRFLNGHNADPGSEFSVNILPSPNKMVTRGE